MARQHSAHAPTVGISQGIQSLILRHGQALGVDDTWNNPQYEGHPVTPHENYPVVNVSWNDAKAFCVWLSRKEGRTYRLPTDREWSVAVGLGRESGRTPAMKEIQGGKVYPWGTSWPPPTGSGNYASALGVDNSASATPVGNFNANQFGRALLLECEARSISRALAANKNTLKNEFCVSG